MVPRCPLALSAWGCLCLRVSGARHGYRTSRVRPVERPLRRTDGDGAHERRARSVRGGVAPRHHLLLRRHARREPRARRGCGIRGTRRGHARGCGRAAVRLERGTRRDARAHHRAHGRDRRPRSGRRHRRHRRRAAGARPAREDVPRPRRHRDHRGSDLRRRAAGVLGVPARHPVHPDGRRRDAGGPARGRAQAARAAGRQVHLHDPELPEPRRRDAVRRAAQAAARAGPRVRHPGGRGRPLRAAAVRGRAHEAAARARRRGHLPRDVQQDLRARPAARAG